MPNHWKHPFTALVAGPTGSGKTVFIKKLLQSNLIDTQIHETIWCYGEWQPLYDEIQHVRFQPGLIDTLPEDNLPRLIIIDDLMREADGRVVDLFTKTSHHRNISVIFITQNIFHQKKGSRDISLNAHYIVVFKNPRDAAQFRYLARQIAPNNASCLQEAYTNATLKPHGYLLLDLKQDTKDVYRYRTNIFKESFDFYVPKSIKEEDLEVD